MKQSMASACMMNIRRLLVVLFNTICGNMASYAIIGMINRLMGRPIKSVFLFYSVNIAYRRTMIPDWYAKVVQWRPGLGQIIGHNGNWCLSFGITSSDDDFRAAQNQRKLRKLYKDVDNIRRIIGARQMTYSGILPGLFVADGIMREDESPEHQNTVQVVMRAVQEIMQRENMPWDCPVIVLGGRGFIGGRIADLLHAEGREIYSVDVKDRTTIPIHMIGKPALILNITKAGALAEYIPLLWPEAVIVNEVYPEPSQRERELMQAKQIRCYHVTGIEAFALPRFMKAYQGGIPCCAAYLPDKNFRVIVTRLT